MRKLFFVALTVLMAQSLFAAPDMLVLQKDIVVETGTAPGTTEAAQFESGDPDAHPGVYIYIRKKMSVESVMLVETTKDPTGKEDNYAYRALEYNSINGDEVRYLNGKVLVSQYARYSLMSSTVVSHPELGECFVVYVPPVIEYGYPWTRHGTVEIGKGTFINIRTFSKKYCDYTGEFADNPFMFDFESVSKTPLAQVTKEPEAPASEEPTVVLTDDYNSVAAEKFGELASKGKGTLLYSKGPKTITEDLLALVDAVSPKDKVDVVFAIDTTGSMKDDIETLRTEWLPRFFEQLESFKDIRIGLLLYRDYNDSYNYRRMPVKPFAFTDSPEEFERNLDTVVINGSEGGDVPEAVYEALYSSIVFYEWRPDAVKKIILIGDAEPHPKPRGIKKISQSDVIALSAQNNISIDCLILPDDKTTRGR